MKLKYFPTNITEKLEKSCLHHNKLIYVKDNSFFMRKLADINNPIRLNYTLKNEINYILSHNNHIVTVEGSQLNTFYLSYDSLVLINSVSLLSVPLKVILEEEYLIFLFSNNRMQIKKRILEDVGLICDERIIDIFYYEVPYFLSNKGKVYKSNPFFMTKNALCKEEIILLPQLNTKFFRKLFILKDKLVLYSNDKFYLYKKKENVYFLDYQFINNPIEIFSFKERILNIKNGLHDFTDGPIKLFECEILNFYENFFLTKNKIYFLEEFYQKLINDLISDNIYNKSYKKRTEELLTPLLEYDFPKFNSQNDINTILLQINNELYFNYQKISLELQTLTKSFDKKISSLINLEKIMKNKINEVDSFKMKLFSKQKNLLEKVLKEEKKLPVNFDNKNIKELINKIKEKLCRINEQSKREEINELKIIKNVLKRKINNEK